MGAFRKISNRLLNNRASGQKSYSQSGEDRLLWFLANAVGLEKPSYLDIGAYDPWFINNTALFYKNGSRGWNIEPNFRLYEKFLKDRKEDGNLNIAIGATTGRCTLYEMSQASLSTILEDEAKRLEKEESAKIISTRNIDVLTLNDVVTNHCKGIFPDILCVDTEGLEEIILGQLKAMTSTPSIICAETAEFAGDNFGRKRTEIIALTESAGYRIYADTFINTVFIKTSLWK